MYSYRLYEGSPASDVLTDLSCGTNILHINVQSCAWGLAGARQRSGVLSGSSVITFQLLTIFVHIAQSIELNHVYN